MGYPRFGMLDLLKLLSRVLVGVFRSHAAREAETAFLRQQLVVLQRSTPVLSQLAGNLGNFRDEFARDSPLHRRVHKLSVPFDLREKGGASDVNLRRLHATLAAAADAGPKDFAELLLTQGVGARTVRALAMVTEIVHGAPYRFSDPARFSIAHGGKDRHPFPVPITVYDRTIRVLKSAVAKARLGREEELAALKRLDDQARLLEGYVTGPALPQVLDQDRWNSHANGGRSIFGWEPPPKRIRSG